MRDCSQQTIRFLLRNPNRETPRALLFSHCGFASKIEHRPQIPETGVSRDLGSNVILKGIE